MHIYTKQGDKDIINMAPEYITSSLPKSTANYIEERFRIRQTNIIHFKSFMDGINEEEIKNWKKGNGRK